MKILLGSTSEDKKAVILGVFPESEVILLAAQSRVTDQPLDEEMTKQGAINRAKNAILLYKKEDFEFAVGLEGGLSLENELYNLVCVACVLDKTGRMVLGVSPKVPLPKIVSRQVREGKQFGEVIRLYKKSLGSNSPGFSQVEELVSRKKSFTEALEEAWGK